MRLFVGIEIDSAVVRKLGDCSRELQERAAAAAPNVRIGWVPADRLHVTVRFVGAVNDRLGSAISSALGPPLDRAPFVMQIRGVGRFPPRGAVRVVWAGVEGAADALEGLGQIVTARLAACGVPPDERPGHPHVTLARVREARGLRASILLDGLESRDFGWSSVEAITLFESRPSPKGVSYVPLQRTTLGLR